MYPGWRVLFSFHALNGSKVSVGRAPQAIVIAGPNGAGKTSAAPDLLKDAIGIDAFVNADVIAQGLAGFRPESAAFEAGRIMLRRLKELAAARADFAFESTLAGRSALRFMESLAQRGYDVHVFYLWLPSPDLAVARVRTRVAAGGHDVAEPVIRRRFRKSLANFYDLYRPAATTWRLYNGSVLGKLSLSAHGAGQGEAVVVDRQLWTEVLEGVTS
jgi:predicted ABC-type ATPase